jgi:hypothetical protein
MGIIEDRASRDAKIVVAAKTVVLLAVRYFRDFRLSATRAFDTIAPAQSFQVFTAFGFVTELLNQRAKINGVCHA